MSKATAFTGQERQAQIPAGAVDLEGSLTVPDKAHAIVLFAHGSGSSRHSPRNRFVARSLQQRRLGTLLMDLLTAEEEAVDAYTARLRFDIGLLSERLAAATDWLSGNPATQHLSV